ncbi:hypothetical protein, partial [Phormidium sp. CCY1219]|uniref:hypothetical protein n=1 Tax=Phormidium sp. CCY1219 TaxID=2886104 RepID=UPI002D1E761C
KLLRSPDGYFPSSPIQGWEKLLRSPDGYFPATTPGLEKNCCVRLMVISPTVQSRAEKKPLRWLNGYFPITTPGLEKNHCVGLMVISLLLLQG